MAECQWRTLMERNARQLPTLRMGDGNGNGDAITALQCQVRL